MRFILFFFSFFGEGKKWLNVEPIGSDTTRDDPAKKFLIYFFPFGKTGMLHSEIMSFN